MPPEQLAGQVNATSDLYALGATALQMLTHKNPWEFMDGSQLKLPALSVSRGLLRLLQRLLAVKPQSRFPGAAEALAAVVELDSLR